MLLWGASCKHPWRHPERSALETITSQTELHTLSPIAAHAPPLFFQCITRAFQDTNHHTNVGNQKHLVSMWRADTLCPDVSITVPQKQHAETTYHTDPVLPCQADDGPHCLCGLCPPTPPQLLINNNLAPDLHFEKNTLNERP